MNGEFTRSETTGDTFQQGCSLAGMKMSTFCSFVLVIVLSFLFQTRGYLIDITGNAFGETSEGFLAAFGDFDSDKKTDLFVITENGKSLSVFFAKDEGHFVKSVLVNSNSTQGFIITAVVPADFDGDSQMDVLLVKHDEGQITQPCTVEIHWGSPSGKSLDVVPTVLPETFQDQPLVMDANGDFIPDLFGENSQGNRSYWIFSATRNVTKQQVVNGSSNNLFPSLKKPHGSAFVDLDKDLTPDLLVVSQDGEGKVQFEWWLVQNGKLTWNKTVPIMDPPGGGSWKHVGIVTFSDINHDEQVNLVVPVCEDDDCTKSHILIYSDKWIKVEMNLERPGSKDSYGFVPPSKHPMTETVTVPIMLRVADYTMDGYPDLIVTLYNTQNMSSSPKTYILINTACPDCADLKRSFSVVWEGTDLTPTESAVIPTFYDYEDNGNLDVIITAYAEKTKQSRLKLFQSKSTDNMCFLKVMVLSGLCNGKCSHGAESYGVNLPGPTTWYHTLNSEGDPQISTVTQLSQSAHFALQTPYTIIGLGPTPNFVEEFTVGVQHPDKEPLNKSWTYIVPNSQLIVIPTPQETPSSWKYKLFMTPSELVLLTGASLLGTCGLIGIIVGLLHWRERVADKREKLQESQKFHFDAM